MNIRGIGLIISLLVLCSPAFAEVSPESIIQIYQRLDNLEKEARILHGENEVLKHELEQLKKVQKEGFLNVDERIDELSNSLKDKDNTDSEKKNEADTEKSEKSQDVVKVIENPTTAPAADVEKEEAQKNPEADQPEIVKPEVKTEADTSSEKKSSREPTAYEKETYQAAFNKMNSSPTAATKAFEEYIKMQPDSPLAANAQYWIGEIMYSHNNYKGAVQEFIKVLQKYKYSNKAPDAAIKLGYSFYALKNWAYARRTFEDVLKYFPENENAVNLATQRLEKMNAAGN